MHAYIHAYIHTHHLPGNSLVDISQIEVLNLRDITIPIRRRFDQPSLNRKMVLERIFDDFVAKSVVNFAFVGVHDGVEGL